MCNFFFFVGGNVIIVIGGDDNYKNEDEEDQVVISRWAKSKISSQFGEEFLDGRKSFIFSWNKKHRAIHEEALLHYFDPSKKGQKFDYQPKAKEREGTKSAQSLRRGHSVDEERREGSSLIPSDKAAQKRDVFSRSNTYRGELSREDSSLIPSDKAEQKREVHVFSRSNTYRNELSREDSSSRTFNNAEQRREDKQLEQRPWDYDSLQYDATSFSHTTGGSHPLQPDENFPQKTGENYQPSLRTTRRFYSTPQSYLSLTEQVTHPLSVKKQKGENTIYIRMPSEYHLHLVTS